MKTRRDQIIQIGRLLKRADFLRVQASGKKWVTPTCIVQMAKTVIPANNSGIPSASPSPFLCRYGLTITKKIWKNAVDRNRVRRRVRAVLLGILADHVAAGRIPVGTDFVVLPRLPTRDVPVATIEKDLKWAIKRLIEEKNGV